MSNTNVDSTSLPPSDNDSEGGAPSPPRRDFLLVTSAALAAGGAAAAAWPLIDQMNPDASTEAFATVDVDLAPIEVGQAITVQWQGKPVFIRHRTAQEIQDVRNDDQATLIDQEEDEIRVQRPPWLIVIGVCTHLGCIPLGQKTGEDAGEYGGWFCPCHGSHYDASGRIRKGPAPANLVVPPYRFLSDTTVRLGAPPA